MPTASQEQPRQSVEYRLGHYAVNNIAVDVPTIDAGYRRSANKHGRSLDIPKRLQMRLKLRRTGSAIERTSGAGRKMRIIY
jgi:hypothetical protein